MSLALALLWNVASAADWDPGFEETDSSPWTSWGSTFDASAPRTGASALRLTVGAEETQSGAYQDDVVAAVVGETVKVGAWFSEPADGGLSAGGEAYVQIEAFGEGDVAADARSVGFTDGGWTCASAELTVAEGMTTVRLVLLLDDADGGSSVLVDDMVVTTDGWDPCTPRPVEDTDAPVDTDVTIEDSDPAVDTDGADTDGSGAAGCGCATGDERQVGLVSALLGAVLVARRRRSSSGGAARCFA